MASILILGVFAVGLSFNDAQAKKPQEIFQVGEESTIQINKGTGICTSQEESCEVDKVKARFHLLTTEADEDESRGIAQGEIILAGNITSEPVTGITLRNMGPLSYHYDAFGRVLTMTGNFMDQNNNIYDYDAHGNLLTGKNDKAKINLSIQLVGDNGIVIDVTGAGIMGTPWQD